MVLQAITIRSGACVAINSPIIGTTRAMICVFAMVAVGKECVVGDIDIVRIGSRLDDLTQYREAAEAGIEQKNRRRRYHDSDLSRSAVTFQLYCGS